MTAETLLIVISSPAAVVPAVKLSGRLFVDGTFLGECFFLSTSAEAMSVPFLSSPGFKAKSGEKKDSITYQEIGKELDQSGCSRKRRMVFTEPDWL